VAAWDQSLLLPAQQAIARVGLEERAQVPAQDLSHGERRQLEFAMALAMRPSLLLLDEPMAGMGGLDSTRIKGLLSELKRTCTILLVEHDMDAVFSLADRVTVLVAGRNIATGQPNEIRASSRVREAYLGHARGD
jgi:branched-chain amino acid transport system ATP-binding protein